jgi:hypothetical protein
MEVNHKTSQYFLSVGLAFASAAYVVWRLNVKDEKTNESISAAVTEPVVIKTPIMLLPTPRGIVLKPGDKARALWKVGHKWYRVIVRAANPDGSYALTYEDGDIWDQVPIDPTTIIDAVVVIAAVYIRLHSVVFPRSPRLVYLFQVPQERVRTCQGNPLVPMLVVPFDPKLRRRHAVRSGFRLPPLS